MKARSIFWFESSELQPLFSRLKSEPAKPAPAPQSEPPASVQRAEHATVLGAIRSSATGQRYAQALMRIAGAEALRSGDLPSLGRLVAELAAVALDAERVSIWVHEPASDWLKGIASYDRITEAHDTPGYLPAEQFPLFFEAVREPGVLSVAEARDDVRTSELRARHVSHPELQSLLATAIGQPHTFAGVICAELSSPGRVGAHDEGRFLVALADLLLICIGNDAAKRALDEARSEATRSLRLFEGLTRALHQPPREAPLDVQLRDVAAAAAVALDVDRVCIWMHDGAREALTCRALHVRGDEHAEAGAELTAALYPAHFAALSTEPVICAEDAAADPRTSELSDSYLPLHGIASLVEAPIRRDGVLLGAITAEHLGKPRSFSADEIHLATALADLLARLLPAPALPAPVPAVEPPAEG